jgi:hypothetical protein
MIDDETEVDDLEELPGGEDQEDERDEGPGEDGGPDGLEEEDPDGPGPDESEDGQGRADRVEVQAQLPSRQRRSQTRWQAREKELAETRRRAEEAEARAAQLAADRQREEALRQQAATQEREQRRALMTPEERNADELAQLRAEINYNRSMDQFWRADAEDKANYAAQAKVNKVYKRHEAEVEKLLKQYRGQGSNISREQLLRYVIGNEALKMAEQSNKPQSERRKQVSKPINSRGDGASTPGRRAPTSDKAALRKRLEGMSL